MLSLADVDVVTIAIIMMYRTTVLDPASMVLLPNIIYHLLQNLHEWEWEQNKYLLFINLHVFVFFEQIYVYADIKVELFRQRATPNRSVVWKQKYYYRWEVRTMPARNTFFMYITRRIYRYICIVYMHSIKAFSQNIHMRRPHQFD